MTSDLHERLLARIHDEGGDHCGCAGNALERTIRAVIELHVPAPGLGSGDLVCGGPCREPWGDNSDWPCTTIQAIARELGIEVAP